jgi:hypothetical protein
MKTASIKITATVHHVDHNESSYRVRYRATGGGWKSILILREKFYGRSDVVKLLANKGAVLPDDLDDAVAMIADALKNRKKKHIDITNRSGWHADSFVYFTQTFGAATRLEHEGASRINPALGLQQGSVEAAVGGLREPCEYSDYLVFTMSVPASSPLLEIIGEDEGAMYHLHGTLSARNNETRTMSTVGKTLSCRAAASVIGRCRKNDLTTFAITTKGVEDLCFAHNNMLVIFDEEGRSVGGAKGNIIGKETLPYIIPGGKGTVRSNKATQDQDLSNLTWALLALSSGERPLDEPNAKIKRPEGAQVRMLPIPVPAGKFGGIFNRVSVAPGEISAVCEGLARKVTDTISQNFGVIMPAYLEKLVPQKAALAPEVRTLIDTFVRKVGCVDADPWERRFAEKFGIVLAGSILLARFALAPWTEERAWTAIETVYRKSRSASVSVPEAADATLRRLRKLVKNRMKFPRLPKGKKLKASRKAAAMGIIRQVEGHENVVLIPRKTFDGFVKPTAVAGEVLERLANTGVILRGAGKNISRQVMITGFDKKKRRYVCLLGLAPKKVSTKTAGKGA